VTLYTRHSIASRAQCHYTCTGKAILCLVYNVTIHVPENNTMSRVQCHYACAGKAILCLLYSVTIHVPVKQYYVSCTVSLDISLPVHVEWHCTREIVLLCRYMYNDTVHETWYCFTSTCIVTLYTRHSISNSMSSVQCHNTCTGKAILCLVYSVTIHVLVKQYYVSCTVSLYMYR
jgi:hypothetical protein